MSEFTINYSEQEISLIKQKVKEYPWARMSNNDGWELGTNKNYLKEIKNKNILLHLNKLKFYKTSIK